MIANTCYDDTHGRGNDLCFGHVLVLLRVVQDLAPAYSWRTWNCWFFTDVVLSALHSVYGGEKKVVGCRTWTRGVFDVVVRCSTKTAAAEIVRVFMREAQVREMVM